jgi:antirestriction protein
MPRIYIADLAAYVSGRLHGRWIDLADMTTDELYEEIQDILLPGHEEWAIHDYEGFGPIRVGEYDSLETIVGHAERMADEPNKYFAWIESRGESDAENYDSDMVHGPYESESDYFDQWLDNCYGSMDLAEILTRHGLDSRVAEGLSQLLTWIDAEQFNRDNGNPLVEVSTGQYSVEFYEVEQ